MLPTVVSNLLDNYWKHLFNFKQHFQQKLDINLGRN